MSYLPAIDRTGIGELGETGRYESDFPGPAEGVSPGQESPCLPSSFDETVFEQHST